jgi:hypothetical protein
MYLAPLCLKDMHTFWAKHMGYYSVLAPLYKQDMYTFGQNIWDKYEMQLDNTWRVTIDQHGGNVQIT